MSALITDEAVMAAAKSDAEFDGRDWDGMGRADRARYRERAMRALLAALPIIAAEGRARLEAARLTGYGALQVKASDAESWNVDHTPAVVP